MTRHKTELEITTARSYTAKQNQVTVRISEAGILSISDTLGSQFLSLQPGQIKNLFACLDAAWAAKKNHDEES